MDYKKIYKDFIEKCKNQVFKDGVYTERHHTIPRHIGGTDDDDNLIRLTYRQHVFAHKVLWKAYGRPQDLSAYMLMSGMTSDARQARQISNGKANVRSGLLDRIRILSNTPERNANLAKMTRERWERGEGWEAIRKANAAWRGQHHTEEFKKAKSEDYKNRFKTCPEYRARMKTLAQTGRDVKAENSKKLSASVLESSISSLSHLLTKKSKRSKNFFVSPLGDKFESPIFAAEYYGGVVKPHVIENWCKRGEHGWRRIPKSSKN